MREDSLPVRGVHVSELASENQQKERKKEYEANCRLPFFFFTNPKNTLRNLVDSGIAIYPKKKR